MQEKLEKLFCLNFLVVLTSGEKLWRQRETKSIYVTTTWNFGLTIKKNWTKEPMLLLRLSSEILNCPMIIFWTSHLDLLRSLSGWLRSKKVKGSWDNSVSRVPKTTLGVLGAILFGVNPKFQVLVLVGNVILNENSSRTLECEPKEKYYW